MGDVYKIRIDIVCVCIYVMELIQIQKYGGEKHRTLNSKSPPSEGSFIPFWPSRPHLSIKHTCA